MIYKKCCICGRLIDEKEYSAEPYKHGVCCKFCKVNVVDPAKVNKKLKQRYN